MFAKFLSGGVGHVIVALLVVGFFKGYADHFYDRGVEDCEAAQSAADKKVEDAANDALDNIKETEDVFEERKTEVDNSVNAEVIASELRLAQQEGIRLGKEIERGAALDKVRESDNCLNNLYTDTDGMQARARTLQDEMVRSGIGRFRTDASEGLRGASPTETFSTSAIREYPQTD